MNAQNIASISALTPTQEGILFHVIRAPERRAYHSQFSALMQGPLDEALWQEAWSAVIARHAVLRTLFTWEGRDKPLQLVRNQVETPFQTLDWRDASAPEQDAQLEALLERDRDLGFDLTSAPLLRCLSIRLGEQTWRFVLSFHHLILDGWSMRLIIDDARRFYRQRLGGMTPDAEPAPSFTRFVEWHDQRDDLADAPFWQDRLGSFSVPVFPEVNDGETPQSATHVLVESTIDPVHRTALAELARERRITQSSLISAAWSLTLAAYTQQDDLVFGVTMAGRPPQLDDVERMAGLFINTLPLRIALDRNAAIDDFLHHVHARQVELRGVESAPLSVAQRASGVPAGTSLFESIVVYENFPAPDADATADPVTFDVDRFVEYSHFPLALLAVPDDDFRLILISDPQRISAHAAREMLDRVLTVLTAMADPASRRVADLLRLPKAQYQRVVQAFNDTDTPTQPVTALWPRIARAAEQTPDRTAVTDGQSSLTYRELVAAARTVAANLSAHGIAPGEPVAILASRSTPSVAAILGIMASGAAYVPISPDAPTARVAQILHQLGRDAEPAALIAAAEHLAAAPTAARTLLLEDLLEGDAPAATPAVAEEDAAYIIYTSGSTGTPKGVTVSQRNLFHSVDARDRYYGAAPDNYLLLSALTTDSSVAGLFWTLSRGGTLTLARERAEQDMPALVETIANQAITHLLCVPALWALILENGAGRSLASLRVAIVAGEACPDALVDLHAATLPDAALHNEYGPTETTVWCTATQLRPDAPVTIGKPIANTRAYVLDAALQPLPIGVTGELCIGGAQVAPGYFNDPQRTAERFVASPFVADDRLYRTGDRARWRRDGRLSFVGRVDLQIKVRGFRVEPGEIETCLCQHPAVTDAVVMLRSRSGQPNREQLVAFVSVTSPIEDESLRALAAAQLPAHMVPQHFEQLDALPRTPTGKMDRAALAMQRLNSSARARGTRSAPPTTDVERALCAIWREVLGVEQIGVHDDFFALGGDSLLSIRILARAGKANISLSPADFFDHPTIAGQAQHASLNQKPRVAQTAVIGPLPLLPIQQWFFSALGKHTAQWNLSYRFDVHATLHLDALRRAFGTLLKTHDALRSEFVSHDGVWQASLTKPTDVDVVHELDLTTADKSTLLRSVRARADQMNQGLDIGRAPLLRACLVRTAPTLPDQLVIVVHHLIVDAESWGILIQDLTLALTQIQNQQAPRLPAKTDALKTWATRLTTLEANGEFDAAARFYAQTLSPLPQDLIATAGSITPTDNTEGQVANLDVTLGASATDALMTALREARASTQEALLCAVASALGQRTQDTAVRIEVEGHGRDACLGDLDITRTVGWLTSVFPVVIRSTKPWSDVNTALRATKQALRDLPDKGLSYGVIRYGSSNSDSAATVRRFPGAAVLLNFLGKRGTPTERGMLELRDERCGQARAPDAPRPYLLEINTWINDNQLTMNLAWPGAAFSTREMQAFGDDVLGALRTLGGDTQGTAVPQDFPLAGLDQQGLDDLSALLDDLDD